MHVMLINGSPHQHGCTYTALHEVAQTLEEQGVSTEIVWLGTKPIAGCIACNGCADGHCVFKDQVNDILDRADTIDGLIIGAPVYYAGPAAQLTAFMDRLFFAGSQKFAGKPAAAVVSARRAGTTASLDRLTKYFSINNMPIVSSCYWTMVHGMSAEDVQQDQEGLQIMRTLGRNMAWLLKCIEAGRQAGISFPERESKVYTNFIR